MSREIFKTAALFAADLPPMPDDGCTGYRWHFADMADMPLMPIPPAGSWHESAWDSDKQRGASMAEGIRLAREGWPEGAETARRLHEGMQASLPTRKRLARYGIAGAVPSVPRALAGNPMHMRQLAMAETAQRPIITLVCNICVGFDYPPEDMMKHAVAVAGIVDFLEDAGFRCDVLTVARFDGRINCEIATRLKAPEQPLSLASMAFGLGHPTFFRRLMFAILQADPDIKPLGASLGTVGTARAVPELGTFTIAQASRYYGDAPERFSAILAALSRQGCPGIPAESQAA